VYAETNVYRRACVTHTGPTEDFLEIGCAQGVTCHRVQQTSESTASTTTSADDDDADDNNNERAVIGLDKSESSIATARQRYPKCRFLAADVLEQSSSPIMEQLVPPSVVAVDINGNREREAVLQCLEAVLAHWQPRLILVKSRALYHYVTGGGGCSDS